MKPPASLTPIPHDNPLFWVAKNVASAVITIPLTMAFLWLVSQLAA